MKFASRDDAKEALENYGAEPILLKHCLDLHDKGKLCWEEIKPDLEAYIMDTHPQHIASFLIIAARAKIVRIVWLKEMQYLDVNFSRSNAKIMSRVAAYVGKPLRSQKDQEFYVQG